MYFFELNNLLRADVDLFFLWWLKTTFLFLTEWTTYFHQYFVGFWEVFTYKLSLICEFSQTIIFLVSRYTILLIFYLENTSVFLDKVNIFSNSCFINRKLLVILFVIVLLVFMRKGLLIYCRMTCSLQVRRDFWKLWM